MNDDETLIRESIVRDGEPTDGTIAENDDSTDHPVATRLATVNGTAVPALGFGTYRLHGQACFDATKAAIELGYRHIDTAMAYDNEATVGRAIDASTVDREEIFLTTKIKGYPAYLEYDALIEAAYGCLDRLGTGYIDLLLLHWWNSSADMAESFAALERLYEEGVVRNIGVSNFSIERLERAMRVSDRPILTNQIEYHPYVDREEMLAFCREHDILLTAYSPLAENLVVGDEELATIGDRYGKSAAQVALRWLLQQPNVVTIPKASSETHLRENREVFDFSLTDAEMRRIAELDGPLSYRLTTEGGLIYRFRGWAGPYVPERIRRALPL